MKVLSNRGQSDTHFATMVEMFDVLPTEVIGL